MASPLPLFTVSALVPASLPAMSPMAVMCAKEDAKPFFAPFAPPSLPSAPVQHSGEERGFSSKLQEECAAPILRLCPHVYSRWFLAMRSAIRRERVRQQIFREDHDLPKSARIPYERPVLTATEANDAAFCETLVRSLFGDIPADYARDKFRHAIDTGDMRAFKIRLLLIKVRDTLASTSSPLYPHFLNGIEQCISEAETLAGCIPDPSPRRLSHAEQEKRKNKQPQPQHQPQTQPPTSTDTTDVKYNTNKRYGGALSASSPNEHPEIQDIEKPENGISRKRSKTKGITGKPDNSENGESVTVTQNHSVTVTLHPQNGAVVRKARDYHSVDEIMEDIEAGKITPYASSEEICTDIVAGRLNPEEALMFTAAMERYNPEDAPDSDDPTIQELEKECVDMEEVDDPEMDEVEGCDADDYGRDRRQSSISYNPMGFGACRGRYSDSGTDWEKDDEW